MEFIVINIILLLIVIFLLFFLSWVWPPDSPWSPWWVIHKDVAERMCEMACVSKKDIVYELGSGTATALIVAVSEYNAKGVGIEIDIVRYIYSKIRVAILGYNSKIKLIKNNFFNVPLNDATVIFVYLVPKALERLKPKLLKELKPGTQIVSYRYKMTLPLIKHDKQYNIFIYKVLKKKV